MKIARVFPTKTSMSPDDPLAFFGPPTLDAIAAEPDEVHISVTFSWDLEKADELSMIDGLTGVYNRNYLKYRVEEKKKKLIFPFTVIISDCNYLKKVNDQYGHEYGDILLKIVAGTLKEEIPEGSSVIRMGGDEFMILGNGIPEEKASELMTNIQESLKQKSKEKIPLSLAMGSYTVQDKDFCFDEICHKADMRMYEDKKRTKADEGVEIIE